MAQDLFYIASVCHTRKADRYITFWRPDDAGYTWALCWAGKYSDISVMDSPDYYNNGERSIAVPCAIVDSLAIPPIPNQVDGNAGPVVQNNRENWHRLIEAGYGTPDYQPKPEVFTKKDYAK